jgi:hypothetical protein
MKPSTSDIIESIRRPLLTRIAELEGREIVASRLQERIAELEGGRWR